MVHKFCKWELVAISGFEIVMKDVFVCRQLVSRSEATVIIACIVSCSKTAIKVLRCCARLASRTEIREGLICV